MTHYSTAVRDFCNDDLTQIRNDIVQIRSIIFGLVSIVDTARANALLRASRTSEAFYWLHAIFATYPHLATKPAAYPLDLQHAFATTFRPHIMTCIATVSPILWEDPNNIFSRLINMRWRPFCGETAANDAYNNHRCDSCGEEGRSCQCSGPGNCDDFYESLQTDIEDATSGIISNWLIHSTNTMFDHWDSPGSTSINYAGEWPRFACHRLPLEHLYEGFFELKRLAVMAMGKRLAKGKGG